MIAAVVVVTGTFLRDDTGVVAEEAKLAGISGHNSAAAICFSIFIPGTVGIVIAFIVALFVAVMILIFKLCLQFLDLGGFAAKLKYREYRKAKENINRELIAAKITAGRFVLRFSGDGIE